MAPNKRQSLWQNRRVFFLTPQVLQNDLNRGSCKAEEVVLLVADEAHKALGNHAYCQVRIIIKIIKPILIRVYPCKWGWPDLPQQQSL